VPLDYENLDVGTADIAFIRYLLSEDAEDLYYNPGKRPYSLKASLVNNLSKAALEYRALMPFLGVDKGGQRNGV
jgi:hypothetical protein